MRPPLSRVFGAFVRSAVMIVALLSASAACAQQDEIVTLGQRILALQKAARYAEAVPLAERAIELARARAGDRHPVTAMAIGMLAGLHHAQGHYIEAEPLYKKALAINERALGRNHSQTGMSAASLGSLYKNQGRYPEAEALFKRALAIHEKADGPTHALTASSLGLLASLYHGQGRYAEAEPLFKRALAVNEKVLGRDHPIVAIGLSNLGELYRTQGRHDLAEPLFKQALAINEKALGRDHPTLAVTLNNLAELHHIQGRYADAEPLFRRVIAIEEKALGPDHATLAISLSNLAGLYRTQGRYVEAEPLFRRALAISEKALGNEHPTLAAILNNLALLQRAQGHDAEAEPLYQRAIAIKEKALGPDHPDVAVSLNHLAEFRYAQRRHDEAEPLLRRALEIREKSLGPEHYSTAAILGNLALISDAQGRVKEATALYERVLRIQQKSLGREHPATAITLNNLALILDAEGRHAEAEPLLQRALALQSKAYGTSHPEVAATLNSLAAFHAGRKDWAEAYPVFKQSTEIFTGRALREAETARDPESVWAKGGTRLEQSVFAAQVRAAAHLAEQDPARSDALAAEAFTTAQWGLRSEAAAALSRMAARFAQGEGDLSRLVRRRQDLVAHRHDVDRLLIAAVSKPPTERNATQEENWRKEITRIDRTLTDFDATFVARFPDYATLADPEPVSIVGVQGLLRADEALFQVILHTDEAVAWVVTRDAVRWQVLPQGAQALAEQVEALRCGLDASRWTVGRGLQREDTPDDEGRGLERLSTRARCERLLGVDVLENGQPPFDLARAHTLYKALFGPFEDLLGDKHLLVVPTGSLSALPFHVLVTEPADPSLVGIDRYAKAAWLARRQPVTILPSVASLKGLRALAKRSQARNPFIGFGNPLLLGPDGDDRRAWEKQTCPNTAPAYVQRIADHEIRGSTDQFYVRGLVDVERVRRQYPLPETTDELCAVAEGFGASDGAVFLGGRATERQLKRASTSGVLRDYRVVHFATHGLLASETGSLAQRRPEPALMLTPPDAPSAEDDALLTASEVAQLDLDADVVILSACNTAGADGVAGSEALSGLARAFLYAGTRALVVSHWYVNSEAAVMLITETFAELGRRPDIGRAEALRRAMVARIDQGGIRAHPSYWAPFAIVGEGG